MMMNNSGGSGGAMAGSGGAMAGSGGGNEPKAAAAAAADLQKQNALLQSVDTEITSVVDDSTQIVNVANVQAADFVETSEVQSEIGPVDVSVSDGSMNIHPESQDASKPAYDENGKQHITPEVTDVLDAPSSEGSSDAVIVAEENVSEAAISNGLPCTNQQESERDEISGVVENLPSHALHEDAPSGNDTTVNLTDDTKSQGFLEDSGVDTNQRIQDDWSSNWVVLDAPASEEKSDAVIVAEENDSEAATSNGLPCTNHQESERDEISGRVDNLPSHALHEDAPSGNDTTVNLTNDTKSQGFSEDHGVDTNQKIQDGWSSQSEEVTDVNEKHAPIEKVQENNSKGNLNIGGDVCINSAEEAKESSTGENNSEGSLNIGGDVCINSAEEAKVSSTGENNSEGNLNIGGDVCINSAEEAKESSTGENNSEGSLNIGGDVCINSAEEAKVPSTGENNSEGNLNIGGDVCINSAEEAKESSTGENNSEGNLNIGGDVCINSAEEAKVSSTGENNSEGNLNIGGDVCINSAEEAKESSTGENNSEGNLNIGGDVCINSAEEAKESSTEDLSGNVSHENVETLSPNINGPLSLLDSKTPASELAESSAEGAAGDMGAVATKSEAGESVKECTEPHVVSTTTEDSEINKEVNCGSEMNAMKTTPVNVCEDIPPEEVSEMQGSDIKERPAINSDVEVDSDTKSFDSRKSLLVNNDIIKVGKEEDSREEKNDTSGATASVASENKTCTQDLESKVVTSTDTIHTGAKDGVDSQPAENKEGDTVDRTDDKVATTCENGETQNHLPSASSIEGPVLDASERHTVAAEIERRPFYFLPRVPRYDNERLSEQLKHAEDQVDQKTQSRDALRADIQKIRATCKDYDISYKAAMAEERSARKAMHLKRQEIEALQSVITRVKSAASVDDIDSRVHNMEHIIQHETISLKEEKGFIREIKQLKQLREQISSSMGTKDEVKQALEEQEKTEERLKVFRKELDTLKNDLSKAEAVTKAAKKKCDEEWEVQSKLQEQFRAADAVRQEAFAHLQDLKKQQREKNKYFFKYRDDSRAASEMALKKDRAALQSLCSDQVENFMNMWNNDEEFRNYYVRCNTRSTYRRLGTLDGRSLGPDEEPPRITYATRTDKLRTSSDRVEKLETVPPVSAQEEKVVKYEGSKVENNGKAVAKPAEQKSQTTKPKKTIKPEQPASIITELVSGKEEIEKSATKEEEEPPKLTKEEEESIKKEEEEKKQKKAAKMKEQHRLEEIAKAKEAMERKKKREEKAKARAVLKAQKEAEEREKEREKKLRKKERRKGILTSEETATENPIHTSETVIETPKEIEIPKKQSVEESQQIKKSHKPASQFFKQNKSKSVPLPLRNRGSKRKLRQWMWIGLIVAVILVLFLLGNANLSFSPANLWFI